jgi:hypothetical protein
MSRAARAPARRIHRGLSSVVAARHRRHLAALTPDERRASARAARAYRRQLRTRSWEQLKAVEKCLQLLKRSTHGSMPSFSRRRFPA